MSRPKVRLDGGDPADLVLYGGGSINASATVQSGDTLITLPFDSSAAIPLITRGCILDPGDNGGAIVFTKHGIYQIQMFLRACVLAGSAGVFELFEYDNGVLLSSRKFAVDVDFANNQKNVLIAYSQTIALAQEWIDDEGGQYVWDFRVKTSDVAITWRYGATTFTSGQAASFTIYRLCGYYL